MTSRQNTKNRRNLHNNIASQLFTSNTNTGDLCQLLIKSSDDLTKLTKKELVELIDSNLSSTHYQFFVENKFINPVNSDSHLLDKFTQMLKQRSLNELTTRSSSSLEVFYFIGLCTQQFNNLEKAADKKANFENYKSLIEKFVIKFDDLKLDEEKSKNFKISFDDLKLDEEKSKNFKISYDFLFQVIDAGFEDSIATRLIQAIFKHVDSRNKTIHPLFTTRHTNNQNLLHLLVANGYSDNLDDQKNNPLGLILSDYFIKINDKKVINSKDIFGNTILHIAAIRSNPSDPNSEFKQLRANLLKSKELNTKAKNSDGKTAEEILELSFKEKLVLLYNLFFPNKIKILENDNWQIKTPDSKQQSYSYENFEKFLPKTDITIKDRSEFNNLLSDFISLYINKEERDYVKCEKFPPYICAAASLHLVCKLPNWIAREAVIGTLTENGIKYKNLEKQQNGLHQHELKKDNVDKNHDNKTKPKRRRNKNKPTQQETNAASNIECCVVEGVRVLQEKETSV